MLLRAEEYRLEKELGGSESRNRARRPQATVSSPARESEEIVNPRADRKNKRGGARCICFATVRLSGRETVRKNNWNVKIGEIGFFRTLFAAVWP